MKHLKKVIQEKTEVRLIDLICAEVGGVDTPRSLTNIHASDLTKTEKEYCPREVLLHIVTKKKRKGHYIPTALEITFQEGRDKQYRLNNNWLRSRMVGLWECTSCKDVSAFGKAPKGGCNRSGVYCRWVYKEPRFLHPVSKASGGFDALVDIGQPKLLVVETKIIAGDQFKTLKAPLAEHKLRTQLYLRLLEQAEGTISTVVNTLKARILYFMRGHGIKTETGEILPLKEFTVTRDDEAVDHFICKAHAVTIARESEKPLMPGRVCETSLCKRAGSCLVVKECFSGVYPESVTWMEDGKARHTGPSVQLIADGITVGGLEVKA